MDLLGTIWEEQNKSNKDIISYWRYVWNTVNRFGINFLLMYTIWYPSNSIYIDSHPLGLLLRQMATDPLLSQYSVIVIDEVRMKPMFALINSFCRCVTCHKTNRRQQVHCFIHCKFCLLKVCLILWKCNFLSFFWNCRSTNDIYILIFC